MAVYVNEVHVAAVKESDHGASYAVQLTGHGRGYVQIKIPLVDRPLVINLADFNAAVEALHGDIA